MAGHSFKHAAHHASLRFGLENVSQTQWSESFAVQYLGMKKVLHRDIKPANILVQRQPLAAILGDFGAARYVSPIIGSHEGGLSSDICTMWYRAPEVLITQTRYHFPSDVWLI